MRIVVVGSFGSQGDPQYRVHQPAAALAALPGFEVFEVHPDASARDAAALAADGLGGFFPRSQFVACIAAAVPAAAQGASQRNGVTAPAAIAHRLSGQCSSFGKPYGGDEPSIRASMALPEPGPFFISPQF